MVATRTLRRFVVVLIAATLYPVTCFHEAAPRRSAAVSERLPLRDSTTILFAESSTGTTNSVPYSTGDKGSFASFNYNSYWYPVVWAEDLRLKKPTKITLFDVDYVVAKLSETEVICLKDRCPHKSAALSEGRITAAGKFQCAYHGWSFDGTDGSCEEIPQVVSTGSDISMTLSSRTCATAMPAMIHQGMVWVFPGGNLEKALNATPPPTIPEMDQSEFKVTTTVRDFPIDWSILVENILDPDHGIFAHGALAFDLYSANTQRPQQVEEEFFNDGGWRVTARVVAAEKLLTVEKKKRGMPITEVDDSQLLVSTSTLTAPSHIVMARRNSTTGNTNFITAFWVCPVGTGRSRFMSCSIGKTPFSTPKWILSVALNNFLDQDTYLLAGQQKHVLLAEAAAVKEQTELKESTNVRKNTYVYRSPTERLGVRLGAFWDATLSRAPNRVSTLMKMEARGDLIKLPGRDVVLDRETQQLNICPDSQDVVANCETVQKASVLAVGLLGVFKLWVTCSSESSFALRMHAALKPRVTLPIVVVSVLSFWLAGKLRREFFFKYKESFRDRDLLNIPKVWQDR